MLVIGLFGWLILPLGAMLSCLPSSSKSYNSNIYPFLLLFLLFLFLLPLLLSSSSSSASSPSSSTFFLQRCQDLSGQMVTQVTTTSPSTPCSWGAHVIASCSWTVSESDMSNISTTFFIEIQLHPTLSSCVGNGINCTSHRWEPPLRMEELPQYLYL